MKYQYQLDETDCGPACLVMVASHYNLFVSIGKVREFAKTDTIGTNMAGLVSAAQKLNLNANPMRGLVDNSTLDQKIIFPFIAHIRTPYKNNTVLDHFVVVTSINKDELEIWDPDFSKKKYRIKRSDFLKLWTGYVLFLSPSAKFKPQKNEKAILFKFLPLVLPYKKDILIISLSSALLIVLGIVTSYYYKYIIDEVIIAKSSFTLKAFSIGMLVIALTQAILESLRGLLINHFAYKSDLQLNFSYIAHIFKLPLSFFERRKTGDIISRLSDINKIREMLCGTALSLVFDCALILIIGPILFKTNGTLAGISIVNVVLMSIIIFFFSKRFKKHYGTQRKEEAEANSTLVEAISGVYTIKGIRQFLPSSNFTLKHRSDNEIRSSIVRTRI
ncbi:MAG: hypothetical protein Ta2B_08610 [Termitinemataceae bacterium]|nr:MAG: hypothetical protein Ta2B_08610 [Termitinemataceae bacterium]